MIAISHKARRRQSAAGGTAITKGAQTSGVAPNPPTPHVANTAARYGLTGIAPGYEVIQDDAAFAVVITGGDQPGTYYPTLHVYGDEGKTNFLLDGQTTPADILCSGILCTDGQWRIRDSNGGNLYLSVEMDAASPVQVAHWQDTFGNPVEISAAAIPIAYRYVEPNTTLGGHSVWTDSGLPAAIYTIRGQANGRSFCGVLGVPDETVANGASGVLWNGGSWVFYDDQGQPLWYSYEDVPTFDLVGQWYDSYNDNPVALTTIPVSQADLNAGCNIDGQPSPVTEQANGHNDYTSFDFTKKVLFYPPAWTPDYGGNYSTDQPPFPWQADFSSCNPVPIVVRNDVASAANWEVVV